MDDNSKLAKEEEGTSLRAPQQTQDEATLNALTRLLSPQTQDQQRSDPLQCSSTNRGKYRISSKREKKPKARSKKEVRIHVFTVSFFALKIKSYLKDSEYGTSS